MHPLWCSNQEGGLLGNPINSEGEIFIHITDPALSRRVKKFLLTLKGRVICIKSDKGWFPHVEC